MKTLRFLLFVFLPVFGSAQNTILDSLYRVLSKTTTDTSRFVLQNRIGEELFTTQPDSALALWKRTEKEILEKQSNYKGAALSNLLCIHGNVLNNIAFIYSTRGMEGPALEYNFKSFHLRESINDRHGIAESLNNIAFLYLREHDTTNALDYFSRSAKGYEAIHDSGGIAFTMTNEGMIQLARGHDSLALEKYSAAMNIFSKLPDQERGYASSLAGVGNSYLRLGHYADAIHYFHLALAIREKNKDRVGMSGSYLSFSRLYLLQHRTDSALFYGLKGYALARESKSSDNIISGAMLLSNIYREQNDFHKALDFRNIYIAARDSISNEQMGKELVRQQLSYEYAKKTAADSVNNADAQKVKDAEIAARDSRLAQEELQKYILYGGIILLLGFALVVFNRFRVTRRQKDVIEQQKIIVEEKQKEVLDSIQYATRIQHALLAGETLLKNNLSDYSVFYQPKDIVSGDFYWASASESKFWLCVADCTGHGVPGAFMSLLNISFLNEGINEKRISTPAKVFGHMRERVINALASDGSVDGGQDGMDGVLCCFDFTGKILDFACANNPLWLIRNENGIPVLQKFGPDKMPVGKHARDQQDFTQHSINLQKDDLIYLFTDGLPDQFGGPNEKKFTYRRLEELVLKNAGLSIDKQAKALTEAFRNWKGNTYQVDDILLIAIRIN